MKVVAVSKAVLVKALQSELPGLSTIKLMAVEDGMLRIAATFERQASQKIEVLYRFPCSDGIYQVVSGEASELAKQYPRVDVPSQMKAMEDWLNTRKSRLKTKRGMKRFISSWLTRASQPKAGDEGHTYEE